MSSKMAKTIVVSVERRFAHPRFRKVVSGYKNFYAHDEKGEAKVGDQVRIQETRPISKTKRWRVVEILTRALEGGSWFNRKRYSRLLTTPAPEKLWSSVCWAAVDVDMPGLVMLWW